MNDEEMIQTPEPVIDLPPDIEPQPDPEPTAPSVEVIPVDELLDRLAELLGEEDPAPEETAAPDESVEGIDGDVDIPIPAPDPVTGLVETVVEHLLDMIIDLGKIEGHLNEIKRDTNEIQLDVMTIAQTLDHPALTTSFADYTVTEALLLLLLLSVFISACVRMLRGGFSWLRS